MRCAKCGKEMPWLPHALDGHVKVRCRGCFGAAPTDDASPIGDFLDRGYEGRLAIKMKDRWSEVA